MAEGLADLEVLIARAARGDRASFGQLYAATSAKLFGVVLRICRDRILSEDVLQEAYVRIWRHADRYEAASGRPVTWMAAIARNAAIDAVRRQGSLLKREGAGGPDDEDAIDKVADPTSAAVDPTDREALRVCLDRLDDEQRHCVMLAYLDGYSREELAARYQRPVGTIKTWLHRGLAKLKDCLERG